jgi:outer membrane protein assembly factor BamA
MNTGKDDFSIAELGDSDYFGGRLTATFFDRRFELYTAWFASASRLTSIRDKDGNLILEAQNPPRSRGHTAIFGTRFDLTDDYTDPRRGLRADVSRTQSPPQGSGPDYFVMDYSATAYIPIARWNTVAINLLRSDAFVRSEGETDPAALQAQLGIDCASLTDPAQQKTCNEVIATTVAANKYGTATQLGGFNRLRSYSQGRFKGAHTLFLGAEYRWNLTDEATPFDIFVMKGVRTSIQIAFFYETGVTSDDRDDLTRRSQMRNSYGAGFRIVTASGVVFRADLAHGKEGFNAAIFIGYPWELQ